MVMWLLSGRKPKRTPSGGFAIGMDHRVTATVGTSLEIVVRQLGTSAFWADTTLEAVMARISAAPTAEAVARKKTPEGLMRHVVA
jgi:hypothetical protein